MTGSEQATVEETGARPRREGDGRLASVGSEADALSVGEADTQPDEDDALGAVVPTDSGAPGFMVARRNIHEALFPDVGAHAVKVGRFELRRRLGQGGMGEIYVAYDEQLDREVAVKLLLRERASDPTARDRLLREAQVLARLSHPNVVQIHEAGVHEGQVYLAMELVDGVTLREWLEERPDGAKVRPRSEVLPVMLAAGRGLAAAHAAGLTHRDFKPDNVLVGHDGRVRVLDFGLARPGTDLEDSAVTMASVSIDDPTASGSGQNLGSGSRRDIVALTQPGRVVGTLAYMSPEQIGALPLDARADQFSFCVTLYEALFGVRPFIGRTFAAHLLAVTTGSIAEPEDRVSVPRWLRSVVQRGLSVEPEARFADMDTLLHELSRPRGRGWKGAAVAGVLLAGGVGLRSMFAPAERPPCDIDESTLSGTWDAERREALTEALSVPGYSAASAEAAERTMSAWSERWVEGLRSACEATRVAGTQSEALLDRRTACLEHQRRDANAIVELLTGTERVDVGHAFELLHELPDAAVCDDARLADAPHPLPKAGERREAILDAYEQLGRARGLSNVGRLDEADGLAEQIAATAKALDYLPLSLEVRLAEALRSFRRKRLGDAVAVLHAVIHEAEVAGLDELSATASTRLAIETVGDWDSPGVQALELQRAETAVARIGRPDERRVSLLELAKARWIQASGDYEGALAGYRTSIDEALKRDDLWLVAVAQLRMGRLLVDLQRFEEAERAYADSRATYERVQGPSTLVDASIELNWGMLELTRGRFDAARERFGVARAVFEPLVSEDSGSLNLLELAEAKLAFMRGDLDGARRSFERVIEIGADDRRRAEAWEALGVIRFYQADMPGSLEAYRRARTYRLASFGPEHPSVGVLDSNTGETLAALGDHQGALESFSKALDLLERTLPPEHADLALPFKGRAQSRLALGDAAGARIDLERALLLHEANPGEPVERADVERTLAEVLLELGERERALLVAEDAHARLREHGQDEAAATLATWIDEHR
ncbi:MAG: serine/threonine-protein kinase [Myxococcota bacterium]